MMLKAAAERINLTYRKADHWATKGYIETSLVDAHGEQVSRDHGAGTGYFRTITAEEFRVLSLMNHLVTAGVGPRAASSWARQVLDGKPVRVGPLTIGYASVSRGLGSS